MAEKLTNETPRYSLADRIAQWREQAREGDAALKAALQEDVDKYGRQFGYMEGRVFAFDRCADEAEICLKLAEAPTTIEPRELQESRDALATMTAEVLRLNTAAIRQRVLVPHAPACPAFKTGDVIRCTCGASRRFAPVKDGSGDYVCEHGVAVDVHCCHCHNGFIFDPDHACAEAPTPDVGCDTPWSTADLLRRLADAADHLLAAHDCDAHGWEGVGIAAQEARRRAEALAPPAPDWQPIETYQHPDGESIGNQVLIAIEGELVGEAYLNPKTGQWWWSGTMEGEYADSPIHSTVTHWMPLPAPPRADARDRKDGKMKEEEKTDLSRVPHGDSSASSSPPRKPPFAESDH